MAKTFGLDVTSTPHKSELVAEVKGSCPMGCRYYVTIKKKVSLQVKIRDSLFTNASLKSVG